MTFPFSRRLFLVLVTGLAFAASAQAAQPSTNYVLKVTADRADALYQRGETVAFTVTLTLAGQPVDAAAVSWIISKDGVPPTQTGKAQLRAGTATLTGKLDEPGFLQCRVTFITPGKSNLVALGGAGIDPAQIKPGLPPPEDFDTFWAAQKKQLAAVPVNARLTPEKSPTNVVEVFDLQADSLGAPVSGYFARPVGAKPKSLPVILTVHGAGVQSSSLAAVTGWAARNFLALDINAHGIPNGRPKQFYTDLAAGELKDYRTRGRESRDTVYFRGMFLRLVRALDFLTAQPEWDGRTVVVHGSSQGGFQSIVAAGLDARVTFIAAGVPAGCDHTGFKARRINGWPKFIATGETPPPNVVEAVRYYDAANFATRTKAAGIVTVGFIDTTCPPSSVYAAYNALPGKKEIFNDIAAGHTNTPKAVEKMRAAILAHVAAVKK
ncbi:MAG: acetylxylan esterase [Verrucomicrobia bacterium]|nr:acetylxylan esterase [Verrucomicrobiota bacterium]